MADYLVITPAELKAQTILGGNVDQDKYLYVVADAQISVIEPMLGTELYDKILADAEGGTITGVYQTILNEFVKPIVKHYAIGSYITIANFELGNGGLYKNAPANKEVVSQEEALELAQGYKNLADMFILRFEKWICNNSGSVPEYKLTQDDVNARRGINTKSGWYFGERGLTEDQLW